MTEEPLNAYPKEQKNGTGNKNLIERNSILESVWATKIRSYISLQKLINGIKIQCQTTLFKKKTSFKHTFNKENEQMPSKHKKRSST